MSGMSATELLKHKPTGPLPQIVQAMWDEIEMEAELEQTPFARLGWMVVEETRQ